MTYPPPDPGSPGPAAGWPTGDPHEQPTQHAYPAGSQQSDQQQPPGYPTSGGTPGYPQPGQQPGYPGQQGGYPGQQPGYPGQQPYPGQPGYQPGYPGGAAPGSPGAPGYPPGPPGYGPPPGYPYPGMPGQPPGGGGKKTGLLIASVAGAAVLVLLLVGVGGVLVFRSLDSDDPPPVAQETDGGPDIEVPGNDGPEDEPDDVDDPPGAGGPTGGGEYGYREGLCDDLDVSSALDILPEEHTERFILEDELNFGSSTTCTFYLTDDRSFGTLSINVNTYHDAEFGWERYQSDIEFREEDTDEMQEADGPWSDGWIFYGAPIADAAAELCVFDGNLKTCVRFSLAGEAANDYDMGDAVTPIAADVLALSEV